jgi:hypothetical protein
MTPQQSHLTIDYAGELSEKNLIAAEKEFTF